MWPRIAGCILYALFGWNAGYSQLAVPIPLLNNAKIRQDFPALKRLNTLKTLKPGQAAIYGRFIQRLAFRSGGLPQEVWLQDVATKQMYSVRVKPTMRSAKINDFVFLIPPGTYAIMDYWWWMSNALVPTSYVEPVTKGQANDEVAKNRVFEKRVAPDSLERFTFTAAEDRLTFTGIWHFETGQVFFENRKEDVDADLSLTYQYVDFSAATTSIPQ